MIRALVIDDDPDVRTITTVALKVDRRFAVETTQSARTALARLRDDCVQFDAVLLGTTTPDMDGALIELIRQRPDCRDTPIVFLGRHDDIADDRHYRAMGAAGIIALPFDPTTFARQITDLIGRVLH